MTRALAVGALIAALAGAAHADGKADAKLHHARGRAAFEAGQYESAIAQFELAYKSYPAPEFLFNLAQVYRKLWRCEARKYLEQFLATKPEPREEAAARKILAEVEPKCPLGEEPTGPASQPTTPTTGTSTTATATPTSGATTGGGSADPATGVTTEVLARARAPWAVSAQLGIAYTSAGDVIMPVVPSFSLAGTRALGPRWLRVGARLSNTPLPYDQAEEGTSQMTQLLAIAEASGEVLPSVRVGGELGAGVLVWTGVGDGNPFTDGAKSAALVMPTVRLGGAIDFQLSDMFAVRVSPALSLSPAANKLADDIGVLATFEGHVGVVATF